MSLAALFTQLTQSNSGANFSGLLTTIAAQNPPITRLLDSEPDLVYQGNVSLGVVPTDTLAAIRGNSTIDTGCTLLQGYLYGVQGKITLKGTINQTHGEYNGALVGQLDFSAATAVTAVNGLGMCWLDAGASAIAGSLAKVSGLIITNTVATNPLHAVIAVPLADAVYFMDLNDTADSHWVVGTTATTAAGTLKCLVNGAVRYIQLFSAES